MWSREPMCSKDVVPSTYVFHVYNYKNLGIPWIWSQEPMYSIDVIPETYVFHGCGWEPMCSTDVVPRTYIFHGCGPRGRRIPRMWSKELMNIFTGCDPTNLQFQEVVPRNLCITWIKFHGVWSQEPIYPMDAVSGTYVFQKCGPMNLCTP